MSSVSSCTPPCSRSSSRTAEIAASSCSVRSSLPRWPRPEPSFAIPRQLTAGAAPVRPTQLRSLQEDAKWVQAAREAVRGDHCRSAPHRPCGRRTRTRRQRACCQSSASCWLAVAWEGLGLCVLVALPTKPCHHATTCLVSRWASIHSTGDTDKEVKFCNACQPLVEGRVAVLAVHLFDVRQALGAELHAEGLQAGLGGGQALVPPAVTRGLHSCKPPPLRAARCTPRQQPPLSSLPHLDVIPQLLHRGGADAVVGMKGGRVDKDMMAKAGRRHAASSPHALC